MTTLTLTLEDDLTGELRVYEKHYEEDVDLHEASYFFLNSLEVLGYTYVTEVAISTKGGSVVKSHGW